MRNHLLRATAGNKPAGGTDDNIANVELLLQGEGGSNGQSNIAFVDSSVNNYSISRTNDVTQGSFSPFSPKGWSGEFDGSNDYLRCDAALDDFTNTSDNFTIEAWFNSRVSPSTFKAIFGVNYDQGRENNLVVGVRDVSGTPKISFHKHLTTGSSTTEENYGSFELNTWNHIAATYDGSFVKLYLNGTEIHSVNGAYARTLSTCSFCIGAELDIVSNVTNQPGNYFEGYISNVRVVKDVLYTTTFTPPTEPFTAVTNTKLLTLQDNRFIDNSASNHSITVNNYPAIKATSPFSGDRTYPKASYFSGKFDGTTSDYLQTPSSTDFSPGTGDWTTEAWVYLTAYPNGKWGRFWWPSDDRDNIDITGTDTSHGLSVGTVVLNRGGGTLNTSDVLPLNQWVHVAVVRYNNTSAKIFFNGVEKASSTSFANPNITASRSVYIGANGGTGSNIGIPGYISNVRYVREALYTTTFTPSTTPLTPVANTKLLTLQDNYLVDHSASGHSLYTNGSVDFKPESPFSNNTYPADAHVSWQFDGSNDYINIPDVNFEKTSITSTSDLSGFSLAGNYSSVNSVLYFCKSSDNVNNAGSSFKWQTARRFDKDWSIQVRVGNGNPTHSYIEKGFQIGFATSNSTTYHSNGLSLEPQATRKYSIELTCYGVNSTYIKLYDGSSSTAIASSSNIVNTMALVGEYDYWFDYDHSASTIKIYQANSGGTKPSTPAYTFNNVVFDDTELYTSIGAGHNGYFKADWTLKQWILDDGTSGDFTFGTGDFTWECWFNRQTSTGSGRFLSTGPSWGASNSVGLGVYGSTHPSYPNKIFVYSNNLSSSTFIQSTDAIVDNKWYHVAFTRHNGTFYVFLNGVLQGSNNSYSGSTENSSTNTFYISGNGANAGTPSTENFLGYISNARVVKGTALYTSDFTVPTEPLTAVSGTKLLTLQSGTLVDNSASGHTFTNNGAAVTEVSPFGAALIDRVGSVYLQGSTDFLTWGASHLNGNFTWEFWVYPTHTDDRILFSDNGYSNIQMFRLNQGSVGTIGFYNGSNIFYQINAGVQPFAWNHLALSRGSDNVQRLFVNGVQKATASNTYGWRPNKIGQFHFNGNPNGNSFKGYMSDIRIVHGTQLYASNFTPPTAPLQPITNTSFLLKGNNGGIEDSLGKRTLENYGNVQIDTTVKKFGSGAIEFDGYLDYLTSTESFDFSGDWTLEFWFYLKSLGSHAFFVQAGPNWNWTSTGIQFTGSVNSSNQLVFTYFNGSSFTQIKSSSSLSANTWYYCSVVREGSQISLYLDGQRVATSSASMGTMSGSLTFGIGSYAAVNSGQSQTLNGYLDDFRITTGVARYDPTQTTHDIPSTTHPTE